MELTTIIQHNLNLMLSEAEGGMLYQIRDFALHDATRKFGEREYQTIKAYFEHNNGNIREFPSPVTGYNGTFLFLVEDAKRKIIPPNLHLHEIAITEDNEIAQEILKQLKHAFNHRHGFRPYWRNIKTEPFFLSDLKK